MLVAAAHPSKATHTHCPPQSPTPRKKAYVVDNAPSGSLVTCDDAATLSRCRASPAPAANASYVDEGSNLLYKITREELRSEAFDLLWL